MNTNNVVSHKAAADLTGKENYTIKLTSTGINLAASSDRVIGTLRRAQKAAQTGGTNVGEACDIYLCRGGFISNAILGFTSAAIALGDPLAFDSANPGKLVPSGSNVIAIAWEALSATGDGYQIQALFLTF